MINKRLFGSDLHPQIKAILEARQKVAEQANPGESIEIKGLDEANPNNIVEKGIDELIAPVYFTSASGGAQRLVYAIEDCIIVNVHHNPTNTEDLEKLEKHLYAFSWEEYEDFINKKMKDEKNK